METTPTPTTYLVGRSNGFSLIKVPGGWKMEECDGYPAGTFAFEGSRCHVWDHKGNRKAVMTVRTQTSNRDAEAIRIFVKLAAAMEIGVAE